MQMHGGSDGGDQLAGLYLLAQQWLSDVLSAKFSELQGQALDMDAWFANPKIAWILRVSCSLSEMYMRQRAICSSLISLASSLMTNRRSETELCGTDLNCHCTLLKVSDHITLQGASANCIV